MKSAYRKLKLITTIWNDLVLNEKFMQTKLRFDEEKDTNFYGEVMHYLDDTFSIVEKHDEKKRLHGDFDDYILYIIGFLQTLYVHQDLVDELRINFNLPSNSSSNKKYIRSIRNELVGHPISRNRNKKLMSSTFWGGNLSYNKIHYIRYENGDFNKANNIMISVDELIERHKKYLNTNFDEILKSLSMSIGDFVKALKCVKNLLVRDDKNLETIIKVCKLYVSSIDENIPYISHEYAIMASEKASLKERYKFYLEYYYNMINESVDDMLSNCNDWLIEINNANDIDNGKFDSDSDDYIEIIEDVSDLPKIIIVSASKQKKEEIAEDKSKRIYPYLFSKLAEKKYFENIDYLIANNDDEFILDELQNMKDHFYSDSKFEYYCSFLYLKNLLGMLH